MAKQWYFLKDGQQHGPILAVALKQKANSGELGPDDSVRPEDRQNWVKAAAVKGLFSAQAAAPPLSSKPFSPPASSVPSPVPTGSADSESKSSSPNDGPQQSVRPFIEWYRAGWLSQKSGQVQFLAWAAFGFVWIPYWYFWTATPPGNVRGKWTSLGRGRQVAYVVLTGVLCLVLSRAFVNRRDDVHPSGNLPQEVISYTSGQIPRKPSISTPKPNDPIASLVTAEEIANIRVGSTYRDVTGRLGEPLKHGGFSKTVPLPGSSSTLETEFYNQFINIYRIQGRTDRVLVLVFEGTGCSAGDEQLVEKKIELVP